jgi:hypothetical protein
MTDNKPLSPQAAGYTSLLGVAEGAFDFMAQHYQKRAAFAIQKSQAKINEMFNERNFQVGMEALLQQKAANRKELSDAAREASAKKAANEAALRVARAEAGGTNLLADEFAANESAHAAFYLSLQTALDQMEVNHALQKGALMNERFAQSQEAQLAMIKPQSMGWLGAAMAGLTRGVETFGSLNSMVNWEKE